jgi:hypothetical protein
MLCQVLNRIDKETQELVARRIKIQFQDHTSLDNQINLKNSEAAGVIDSYKYS